MKIEDIKIGQHFWAKYDGELYVFVREDEGNRQDDGIYVAGCWEGGYKFDELEFICIIERPIIK